MRFLALAFAGIALASPAAAQSVTIGAVKDNTLFESATGALSSGAGDSFYAGRTGPLNNFLLRRGVIAFDVAGAVPPGMQVTGVSLTLFTIQTNGTADFTLHPILKDWGEGTSVSPAGAGAPATAGDATWLHTFSPSATWTTAGGDFTALASGSTSVSAASTFYTWASTPQMVADAQGWLTAPATNFGWLIRNDELVPQTAVRFASKDNLTAMSRPSLTITFAPVPEPVGLLFVGGTVAAAAWAAVRRSRKPITSTNR